MFECYDTLIIIILTNTAEPTQKSNIFAEYFKKILNFSVKEMQRLSRRAISKTHSRDQRSNFWSFLASMAAEEPIVAQQTSS